jgi:hypothetical protein
MLERMRLIDTYNSWSPRTLQAYRPYYTFLYKFEKWSGATVLQASQLKRPPVSSSISLQWAQLAYSVKERAQGGQGVQFATARNIRSTASNFHSWDLSQCYPDQAMRDKQHRGHLVEHVIPTDAVSYSMLSSGMSRRMGDRAKPSWALSHVHVAYIDKSLDRAFKEAKTLAAKHDLACAAAVNLLSYLGWLRGGEVFAQEKEELQLIHPHDAAIHGLPRLIGAICANLLPETKTDKTCVADVVIAYTTLSGLSLGRWLRRLLQFTPCDRKHLFSTANHKLWSSGLFRKRFAIPILDQMRRSGEPSLQIFSDEPGHRLCDGIYSMHSWRRAGRSRVSRPPRENEPRTRYTRKASTTEVDEHGRWRSRRRHGQSESMPMRYNQWALVDRVAITYFCM